MFDPNISYVATQGLYGGNAYIHKLYKNSNGSWNDTTYTPWGSSYSPMLDLIGQDSQKIYYTINRNYSDYSFIGYVNKATMTGGYVNIGKGSIKVLKDIDMYIYIACPSVNALGFNVGKYNKVANTITWLYTDTLASGYYSDTYPSDMNGNGVFYCMRDGLGLGMTDHFVGFRKYMLDTQKDIVTTTNVNVDISLIPNGKIYINSASNMAVANTLLDFTDQNTGKKYINHIVYNKGTSTIALNQVDSAIYTYEVIDADNWKLVSYTNFSPIIYKAFLPVVNNQTVVLAYENGAHIFAWDTGTKSYKKVSSFDTPISTIGNDRNNKIYIQFADTSVQDISKVIPIVYSADFKEDSYNYESKDIVTDVICYVKNYQGNYLSTSLTLKLFGDCKFTDDSSKIKTVTTLDTGELKIPVTITGDGELRVSILNQS
jgi:hypothetical protein